LLCCSGPAIITAALHAFNRPTEAFFFESLNPKYPQNIQLEALARDCDARCDDYFWKIPIFHYLAVMFALDLSGPPCNTRHHYGTVREVQKGSHESEDR